MIGMFTPSSGDLSLFFLSKIFGTMNDVLPATTSGTITKNIPSTVSSETMLTLFGTMFQLFNAIILAFAAFMILYVMVVGVMLTAQEGEFMGKKWHNIWVPIRSVLGIAALVPTASGYCALQIVMMWLILQGIGAADQLWGRVLAFVDIMGSPYEQQTIPTAGISTTMEELFKSLTCDASARQAGPLPFDPPKHGDYYCSAKGGPKNEFCNGGLAVSCKGSTCTLPMGPNKLCGTLTYCNAQAVCADKPDSLMCETCTIQNQQMPQIIKYLSDVAKLFVLTDFNYRDFYDNATSSPVAVPVGAAPGTAPVTKPQWQFVYDYCAAQSPPLARTDCYNSEGSNFPSPNYKDKHAQNPSDEAVETLYWPYAISPYVSTNKFNSGASSSSEEDTDTSGGSSPDHSFMDDIVSAYVNPINKKISDYFYSQMAARGSDPNQFTSSSAPIYAQAQTTGWVLAGAYYYFLTRNIPSGDTKTTFPIFSMRPMKQGSKMDDKYRNNYQAADTLISVMGGSDDANSLGSTTPELKGVGGLIGKVLNGVRKMIYSTLTATGGPLFIINTLGNSLLVLAGVLWAYMIELSFSIGVASASTDVFVLGTGDINPVTPGVIMAYFFVAPTVMALVGALFTAGALLAVYVPLIPFVLFTFGVIGWLIGVIEAMVAGPIIALAIISPSGQHELLGKAEQGLMLLFNIILRPSLMIFGLVAAILLSNVVITLILSAFALVLIGASGGFAIVSPIVLILFVLAFCIIIVTALNKAFAAIYLIPQQVLTWVGGQSVSYGEGEALGEVKRGTQEQAGMVGKQLEHGAEHARGAAKSKAEITAAQNKAAARGQGRGTLSSPGGGSGGAGSSGESPPSE